MTDETVEDVFDVVAETAPEIRSTLVERVGFESDENPSGEQQIAADVFADQLLEERLLPVDGVGEYASEERDEIFENGECHGIAVDPVDGFSNIETDNAAGTILGIYDAPLPHPKGLRERHPPARPGAHRDPEVRRQARRRAGVTAGELLRAGVPRGASNRADRGRVFEDTTVARRRLPGRGLSHRRR